MRRASIHEDPTVPQANAKHSLRDLGPRSMRWLAVGATVTGMFVGMIGQPAPAAAQFPLPDLLPLPIQPPGPSVPFPVTPTCNGIAATIVIREGGRVSYGTEGRDVIVGSAGDDTIY